MKRFRATSQLLGKMAHLATALCCHEVVISLFDTTIFWVTEMGCRKIMVQERETTTPGQLAIVATREVHEKA